MPSSQPKYTEDNKPDPAIVDGARRLDQPSMIVTTVAI
jgi:hypothetical protein